MAKSSKRRRKQSKRRTEKRARQRTEEAQARPGSQRLLERIQRERLARRGSG